MADLKDKIWVAKYAPIKLEDTILSPEIEESVASFIETKDIPNLLFAGPPGTGKTTLGRVLLNELDVDWGDVLFLNASDINSVDAVRNVIKPFAMSMSINEELPIRFIFLDEADHLSPQAQAALRNLIEASYNSARYILTANYPKKIIPALHSRLQGFTLEKPNIELIADRIVAILENEEVAIENEEDLIDLITQNTGDIRKLIQLLQQNTIIDNGDKVLRIRINDDSAGETISEYLNLFKKSDLKALRKHVYAKFTDTDANEFWSIMIDEIIKNPDTFDELGAGLDNIIYHLNEGQKSHEMVANKLLNILGFTVAALDNGEE